MPASRAAAAVAFAIALGSGYGSPPGLVVGVVDLSDGGVSGSHHLAVELQRDVIRAVRVDGVRGLVHGLAPRPEVVMRVGGIDVLHAPPQGPLEGVAVGVHEAGETQRGNRHTLILPDRCRRYPENGSCRGSASWQRSGTVRAVGTGWPGARS